MILLTTVGKSQWKNILERRGKKKLEVLSHSKFNRKKVTFKLKGETSKNIVHYKITIYCTIVFFARVLNNNLDKSG